MAIQENNKTKSLRGLFSSKKKSHVSTASKSDFPIVRAMAAGQEVGDKALQKSAKKHLWMHFTRHSPYNKIDMTIFRRPMVTT